MFAKVQLWKFRDHWLVNAKPRLQVRHMEKAKSVWKIHILMWCIFGVLQFTPLHSIDCITFLDINRKIIPCRWRHRTIANGISEKHGGRIEKGWSYFCKKSPLGFHLELILKNLVAAYRKKLLKTRTYHFESASLWWKSEKNDWTVFLPSPEESANERVSRRR